MEFSGLLVKYHINRPLTEQERAHHLQQKRRLNLEPHYQLSVIAMNSTYLESVDKWFAWKGVLTAVASLLLALFGWMALAILSLTAHSAAVDRLNDGSTHIANGLGIVAAISLLGWPCVWLLRKESFAYTHYPLRFNRKTRMVHVFQLDGTTISVPWDEIFFTLGKMGTQWEVRGHVLDADRDTVRATFALSCVRVLSDPDIDPGTKQFSNQDLVRSHWEFIRRYMEEGPKHLSGQVQFCMPVDGRRESAKGGAQRVFANFAEAPVLLWLVVFPLCAIISLFRILAMRTSRIPSWPKNIDEVCIIAVDDPFAIRGDVGGDRVAVYPNAAHAAGVRFVAPPCGPASR